jgi:DNA-binding response OmpR family regulator
MRILLVEDNKKISANIVNYLKLEMYDVEAVYD